MESNKAVAVPTGDTLSLTQEAELVRLHQATTRDTLAIGTLLIAMRSKQPRGDWTAYLDGVATRTEISRRTLFRYIRVIEKPAVEKPPLPDFRKSKSPNGHDMGTLQSWLQKSIRRGDERNALYAAAQLAITGFPGAVFNVCCTMSSEDIGLAERGLVQEVLAIHAAYKLQVTRKSEHKPERLQIVHAVLLCCRAKKSRLVDHALVIAFEAGETLTPPAWVFDKHTSKGKAAGKTVADFYDTENPALSPKSDIEDQYAEEAKRIRTEAAVAKKPEKL